MEQDQIDNIRIEYDCAERANMIMTVGWRMLKNCKKVVCSQAYVSLRRRASKYNVYTTNC